METEYDVFCYKVVRRMANGTLQSAVPDIEYSKVLIYVPGRKRKEIKHWHGIFAFDTFSAAQAWKYIYATDLEIWSCYGNGPLTSEIAWPDGTLLFEEIELIERVG